HQFTRAKPKEAFDNQRTLPARLHPVCRRAQSRQGAGLETAKCAVYGGATAGPDGFCARRHRKSVVGAGESLHRGRTKERVQTRKQVRKKKGSGIRGRDEKRKERPPGTNKGTAKSQEAIDDVINSIPAEFCERMRRRWRTGLPGACEHW